MVDHFATAPDTPSDGQGSDDVLLARRCARGDAGAFERLVAAHQDRIHRLVYRLLGWDAAADDVVQDVFLAAMRNVKKYRGRGPLAGWLARIAVNRCRSHQRKRLVRWKLLKGAAERATRRGPPTGEAAAMDSETFRRVRAAIQTLPIKCREVVVLRYLEEMPVDRVAELLGVSRTAVNVRLHRARKRLKELLGGLEV